LSTRHKKRWWSISRRQVVVFAAIFVAALAGGYLFGPEILTVAGRMLVAESEPFEADAVVMLAGGGPERSHEAADIYNAGLAPRVVLTTQQLPDNFVEMERLGIDLFLPHENDLRVLEGLGVPADAIVRIESIATETLDELTRIRALAVERGWTRLILVSSNFHTRRVSLIARYVFEDDLQVAVIGSRYSEFDPRGWWRTARDARTFLIEFQKLLLYEVYLRPRIWF
jgi:uncharacterized SAM-binding protein YcdF (DUF218 family)